MSVFSSTSGSDLNISNLEKYTDYKYSETVKPSQTKTKGCCNKDINCSTSLFNKKNNKQYGSFSQNNPTLREFFTPFYADFDITQPTPLILFRMGLFGAAHGWGGQKGPLSLKSVTHILQ